MAHNIEPIGPLGPAWHEGAEVVPREERAKRDFNAEAYFTITARTPEEAEQVLARAQDACDAALRNLVIGWAGVADVRLALEDEHGRVEES